VALRGRGAAVADSLTGMAEGEAAAGQIIAVAAILLACGLAFLVTRAAAAGRLKRNHLAGIRVRSVMASDEAWRRGHAAAVRSMTWTAGVSAVLSLASLFALGTPWFAVPLLAGVLVLLTGAGWGGVKAHRAAARPPR